MSDRQGAFFRARLFPLFHVEEIRTTQAAAYRPVCLADTLQESIVFCRLPEQGISAGRWEIAQELP